MTSVTFTGPGLWRYMHVEANNGNDVIMKVVNATGCPDCISHSSQLLPQLRRRYGTDLFTLTVEFHNTVNRRLGKRIYTPTEAREVLGLSKFNSKNLLNKQCVGCNKRPNLLRRK